MTKPRYVRPRLTIVLPRKRTQSDVVKMWLTMASAVAFVVGWWVGVLGS